MSEQIDKEVSYEFNTDLSSLEGLFWDVNLYDVDYTQVKKWLKDHITFNQELRLLSRRLYNANGIYTNVVDYMVSLPTLDRVVFSFNNKHSRFAKNKKVFLEVLRIIKDKITARDNILKDAIDGMYFGYFDSNENINIPKYLSDTDISQIEINSKLNCSITSLPTDYCKIVGRKNNSYVMAFDVSYFDQFTSNGKSLKIRKYPKEIRDKYKQYKRDINKKWAVLDNTKTIVTKVRANIDEKCGRPLGLAAFLDMLYDDYFIDTKRNTLDEINNQIVYQTFPEGKDKGTSSLTTKQQANQHNNIKSALFAKGNRKGISFFSIASGTKLDKITTNVEILKTKTEDELIKRIATDLGFAGSALNGMDGNFANQKTNIELVAAEVFSWLEQFQEELNKVINANIIRDQQCYIQVSYLPTTYVNRKEMVGYMKELYAQGKGSLQAWVASTGWNPDVYIALMDEELDRGMEEKYPVHKTSYTSSNKENGRPSNDNSDSEGTIVSKTYGGNEGK